MKRLPAILAIVMLFALAVATPSAGQDRTAPSAREDPVVVHLFWSETCPHCAKAKAFLDALAGRDSGVTLDAREVLADPVSERAFIALSRHFRVDPPAVPLVVVGEREFVGYHEDETTGAAIAAVIEDCRRRSCTDLAAAIITAVSETGGSRPSRADAPSTRRLPDFVDLPLIGRVELRALSLPVLAMVLGAVDGFNPCAMWVLIFLIGLLLGLRDPVRMWSLGAVFLLTSAAVYFAFMAAWLNLFLFLGSLAWIRMAVGTFALAAGGYYLWQFFSNPDAVCPVTSPEERESIRSRLRAATSERSFLLAVVGIAALAVAVNMVELLCSAGIPAVFTHVLALGDLSPMEHYGYLLLYIAVFLVDDAVVFVTAMVTLRASGLAAGYARYSHLIGGGVLGVVGLLLLFRPGWLAFA